MLILLIARSNSSCLLNSNFLALEELGRLNPFPPGRLEPTREDVVDEEGFIPRAFLPEEFLFLPLVLKTSIAIEFI